VIRNMHVWTIAFSMSPPMTVTPDDAGSSKS
jgi:hypothetical protein